MTLTRPPHPLRSVVLRVWSEAPEELTVGSGALRFDRGAWDRPQAVVVQGVRDGIRDGDTETRVNVAVLAGLSDDRFEGAPQRSVSVTVRDGDALSSHE